MTQLDDFYGRYPHFWITSFGVQTNNFRLDERVYYIPLGHFKKPWTYIAQVPRLLAVFRRERPTHILSIGSGRIVFVPYLLSLVFGARFIHIETFSYVRKPTKMGAFLLKLGIPIFTQWRNAARNDGMYIGPVFKKDIPSNTGLACSKHVFVTLGTRDEPFTRLIQAVEDLKREGVILEPVIVQAGNTVFKSDKMEIIDFAAPSLMDQLIRDARFIITQESAGTVTKCLRHQKPFIVMPRDYRFRELPAKSDMNEDLHLRLEELGYTRVVHSRDELKAAIGEIEKLRTGFDFDNSRAISKLVALLED